MKKGTGAGAKAQAATSRLAGMEPVAVLEAAKRHASALAFAPDGQSLVTGGMEGALRVWSVGDWQPRELKGHTGSVNGIQWQGDWMATAGSDKAVCWWRDGDLQDTWNGYVGIACHEGALALRRERSRDVEIRQGQATNKARTGHDRIMGVTAVPGGWAISGLGPDVEIRDVDGELMHTLGGHQPCPVSVAGSDPLVTTDGKGRVRLWRRGKEAGGFAVKPGYAWASPSPDGKLVATGSENHVGLWTTDGELVDFFEPGLKGVYGVCFSPDGRWLANAAADGRVRVFERE